MKTKLKARRPYEPPAVRKIRVVPGELAVTGCKQKDSRMGPFSGCFFSNCKAIGS